MGLRCAYTSAPKPNLCGRSDALQYKRCSRCGEEKNPDAFTKSKQTPDGLFRWCKDCFNQYQNAKRAANPDYARAKEREYYYQHRERKRAWVDARYQRKKAEILAYRTEWGRRNAEKRRESRRKWRQANRDKVNLATGRRRALRVNAPTVLFSLEQLAARMEYFGRRCWICGGEANAVDHVKPLSKGGWHCLANLRPVCTPCNTRKKDRWPIFSLSNEGA